MKYRYLLLSLILLFGIWLRTYNIANRYGFGWDQQDDAVKVMKMVNGEGFTLIGPRVAGPDSFFVPAWHYYFLVPFYWIFQGSPWAGYTASLFVGILSIIAYYFVAWKLWGERAGLVAAWAGALAYSIVSWNVMYTTTLTVLVFYLGNKMFEDKKYVFPAIVLAFFAGTTHLVPMTLLLMILIGILFLKNKPKTKTVLLALAVGSLSLLPLVIFDLRHDFLNFNKLIQFVGNQTGSGGGLINLLAIRSYYRSFSYMGGYNIGITWYILERILLVTAIIFTIHLEKNVSKKWWYSIWFLLPAILLIFYHGNIPEYYFGVSVALIPLFISNNLSKKFIFVVILFLTTVSYFQINRVLKDKFIPSLGDKENLVKFMIGYSKDNKFNFSYNVPFGEEPGYQYLFKWLKKEPTSTNDSRLYSLTTLPAKPGEKIIYESVGLGIIER